MLLPPLEQKVYGCGVISDSAGNVGSSRANQRVALVAEDEWIVLMEIAETLISAGWTVREADTAESALEILVADPSIRVLITDIRFGGGMDGWELAAEGRKISPTLGVVYVTANEKVAEAMVPGAVFLGKPCLATVIVTQAERLWDHV